MRRRGGAAPPGCETNAVNHARLHTCKLEDFIWTTTCLTHRDENFEKEVAKRTRRKFEPFRASLPESRSWNSRRSVTICRICPYRWRCSTKCLQQCLLCNQCWGCVSSIGPNRRLTNGFVSSTTAKKAPCRLGKACEGLPVPYSVQCCISMVYATDGRQMLLGRASEAAMNYSRNTQTNPLRRAARKLIKKHSKECMAE